MVRTSKISIITLLSAGLMASCSSAPKTVPELAKMKGKKVALVKIEGEATQRDIVEVALINQLGKRGTFEIMNKKDLNQVRDRHDVKAAQPLEIARKAGADYALEMEILKFEGKIREGYSRTEKAEFDPLLAEEQGKDKAKVTKLYKVKSLEGHVAVRVDFTDLEKNDTRSAVAEKTGSVVSGSDKKAARLPPVMGYLQELAGQAFEDFFNQYE